MGRFMGKSVAVKDRRYIVMAVRYYDAAVPQATKIDRQFCVSGKGKTLSYRRRFALKGGG